MLGFFLFLQVKNKNMKPYTKVNKANNDEDLRRNWRGNKNYWRKNKDRPYKKKMRQELKQELKHSGKFI